MCSDAHSITLRYMRDKSVVYELSLDITMDACYTCNTEYMLLALNVW